MKTIIFFLTIWISVQLVGSALLVTDLLYELKSNVNFCKELSPYSKKTKLSSEEERSIHNIMNIAPYIMPIKYMVSVDLAFKISDACILKELKVIPPTK